jgi:hypothetical protein
VTRRIWPTVAGWGASLAAAIPLAGHAFGGAAAAFVAVVIGGAVIGTTDVWGRVQQAERARRADRVQVPL